MQSSVALTYQKACFYIFNYSTPTYCLLLFFSIGLISKVSENSRSSVSVVSWGCCSYPFSQSYIPYSHIVSRHNRLDTTIIKHIRDANKFAEQLELTTK